MNDGLNTAQHPDIVTRETDVFAVTCKMYTPITCSSAYKNLGKQYLVRNGDIISLMLLITLEPLNV